MRLFLIVLILLFRSVVFADSGEGKEGVNNGALVGLTYYPIAINVGNLNENWEWNGGLAVSILGQSPNDLGTIFKVTKFEWVHPIASLETTALQAGVGMLQYEKAQSSDDESLTYLMLGAALTSTSLTILWSTVETASIGPFFSAGHRALFGNMFFGFDMEYLHNAFTIEWYDDSTDDVNASALMFGLSAGFKFQ